MNTNTSMDPFYYQNFNYTMLLDFLNNGDGSVLNSLSEMTINSSLAKGQNNLISSLPSELVNLPNSAWPGIVAYCIVFLVAFVGNLVEFCAVSQRLRKRCSPMNILLMNLCIADLIVVISIAAVEIGWRISIGWYSGDFLCKAVHFFRTFGLYLSSLVLICLSLDRYYAVLHPLKIMNAYKRIRLMLILAWIFAGILSLPQCIVFRVRHHPIYVEFIQCTSVGETAETINTALSLTFMYFLPILCIIFCYGNIIYKLTIENDHNQTESSGSLNLRRSDVTLMDRAKIRALKLSSVIVVVFIFCWTPYVTISLWHVIDRESAEKLNPHLQDALFLMVVANSCANALVYGVFHSRKKASYTVPNNIHSAYTMSTYHCRSQRLLPKQRVSIQTECVDISNGKCVTQQMI